MGAGNPPPALTGREPQEHQFRTLLGRLSRGRNEQSMIIWGLRGVGKTVLLLEFRNIAAEMGWIAPEPIEIKSDTDFRRELAEQAYEALTMLSTRLALSDRLKKLGRVLHGFKLAATAGGSVEVSFDPEKVSRASSGNLERDLIELFTDLGEVARGAEVGVVFLIDEMQFLRREEMEAIAAAMHRMSQRQLPIALAGTGLPQLPGLVVEAKSYAERLFSYPSLDRLDDQAARQALAEPAAEEGVEFSDDALRRILELSGSYPAFLQAYGKEVWNVAFGSAISLSDVEAAEPIVRAKLDSEFFHTRFEKVTTTERKYMAAIAELGDGPQSSSSVAKRMGHASASGASVHRDSLIKKGLIYSPDFGMVDFTVPHFAAFMRRRYPIGS